MSSVTLSRVAYLVDDRPLFQNLNYSFDGHSYGLVGDNGIGKSTLARILAGNLEPSEGHVRPSGVVLYMSQFLDEPLPTFNSGGEKRRAGLTKLFVEVESREASGEDVFVILDEPTNDLDGEGRRFVAEWVRRRQGGLLVISHDRKLLAELSIIVELSSLGLRTYGGGLENFEMLSAAARENAASQLSQAARELRKKKRERIEKREQQEKRSSRAKKAAPASGMPRILLGARKRRAQVTAGNIETREAKRVRRAEDDFALAATEITASTFLRLDWDSEVRPASQVLVVAENLQLASGPAWPIALTFQLRARDRLWLRGPNGIGKSSLVQILRGGGREFRGSLNRAAVLSQAGSVGFLDQNQSGLIVTDTVLEAVGQTSRFTAAELRHELSFYGFTGERVFLHVSKLSGGERLRLALAQIFLGARLPAILILDEPTNNLDFRSLEILKAAIENFPGGILLITHDETFGRSLSDFQTWSLGCREPD